MAEPFRFTTGRWFNQPHEDGSFGKVPAYQRGFEYTDFAYGTDTPEHYPADEGAPGGLQVSLICSPSSLLLGIDVDAPEYFPASQTGQLVSWSDAASVRGSHFHILVDMHGVDAANWMRQCRTVWGDVKTAGFLPWPGSVHKTGAPYAAVPGWETRLVPATPELLAALVADRDALTLRRQAERGSPVASGRLDGDTYVYASSYVRGSWKTLAPGSLHYDDELKDLVWDMHVVHGVDEAEVRETWERLAGALSSPWTDRDFARHWRHAPAERAKVLENDDTLRWQEDFGVTVPPTPLQSEQLRQRDAWEETVGAPVRPPQPPPDWGFEVPGVDYFSMWLGQQVFDAGPANDADNAMAVLTRAHNVLRYDEEAGTWLVRGTAKWESFTGAAGPRAVINGLRGLMPYGCADPGKDPRYEQLDAEDNAGEIAALKAQAKNRERFSASAQIGSVAAVMTDTVLRHRGAGSVVRASQLDAEREVLWAGGVPWNLRATRWTVHDGRVVPLEVIPAAMDRSAPHLMTAPVVPDASVKTPLWDSYCRAVFPDLPPEWGDRPDAGREWALNVFAAAFTGYADAIMPVLLGETRLGKTFLINLLTSVLGDYGGIMSGELLKADARLHGSFTLKLKGMRLAFVDEAPGKGKASQEHLKKITGGGKMEGNKMRENPVEFFPTHTLVLATNAAPELTDPALRARTRMIRFEGDRAAVKAAAAAIGGSVESPAWRAEMPGVLAQMMARAAAWLADRSIADTERAPRDWQTWADELAAEQNPVEAWTHSPTIAYDEHGTLGDTLHDDFTAWCSRHRERVHLDRMEFGFALKALGYKSRKSNGKKWWPFKIVLPGAAEWLSGGASARQGGSPSLVPPTVPATVPVQNPSSSDVGDVFRDGRDSTHTPNTHNAHTHTRTQKAEGGNQPSPSLQPSLDRSDLGERTGRDRDTLPSTFPGAEPVVPKKDNRPENGENGQNAQIADSPPKLKTPRTKLTPEERLERETARKAKLAREREEAKAAKIAELGGPLVQLPAVVLRDQLIVPLTPETARAWLEPCLPELSVDVEHTAFPVGHPAHRLRLAQLGNEYSAVVFDPADPEQAAVIAWALEHAAVLHAHSAHADLVPLEAAGLAGASAWDKMTDTVLLAKLTDPALCDSDEVGLKALAKGLLGEEYALSWLCDERRKEIFAAGGWIGETELDTDPARSGWAQIPVCEAFVRYAASDVLDCAAVARVLTQEGS